MQQWCVRSNINNNGVNLFGRCWYIVPLTMTQAAVRVKRTRAKLQIVLLACQPLFSTQQDINCNKIIIIYRITQRLKPNDLGLFATWNIGGHWLQCNDLIMVKSLLVRVQTPGRNSHCSNATAVTNWTKLESYHAENLQCEQWRQGRGHNIYMTQDNIAHVYQWSLYRL